MGGAVTVEAMGASVWTRRFGVLLGVACLTNLTDQGACLCCSFCFTGHLFFSPRFVVLLGADQGACSCSSFE